VALLNEVAYCESAKDLLGTFAGTIRELIGLHEDQFEALVTGDSDGQRFDDLIHMANERKNRAKYAYVHHLETHCCSTHGTDQE